jgi:cytochrome c553
LYDFRTGARHGKNAAMMQPVVSKLTDEDIVDIAAYLASLPQ